MNKFKKIFGFVNLLFLHTDVNKVQREGDYYFVRRPINSYLRLKWTGTMLSLIIDE
jgi:hypothetical protein